ncbi:MAG: hypothetical protein H3C26_15735 [Rhodocyclaceae bacterium]|nr:hypothetical protein [Rhodocyclaceae bacterium]
MASSDSIPCPDTTAHKSLAGACFTAFGRYLEGVILPISGAKDALSQFEEAIIQGKPEGAA